MVAVTGFGNRWVTPIWNGVKVLANDFVNVTIGVEQSSAFERAIRPAIKEDGGVGFFKHSVPDAWKVSREAVAGKSLWKNIKDSFAAVPGEIRALKGQAGKIGKSFDILYKRMPLLGNIIMIGTSIPSIYSAFTDKENGGGLFTGIKEIGKTAISMAAFGVGSLLGSALGPVGAIAGGMVAGWIASSLLPSFSTIKEEKLAKAAEEAAIKAKPEMDEKAGVKSAPADATSTTTNNFGALTGFAPVDSQEYAKLQAAYRRYSYS